MYQRVQIFEKGEMMSINLSDFAILDIHGIDYDDDKLFLCYNCPTKDV